MEERATRFAWPRTINAHAYARTHVHLHPRNSRVSVQTAPYDSYVLAYARALSDGPISVDHKGPQPSESLRVNNYYRAPHASPRTRSCSLLVLAPL